MHLNYSCLEHLPDYLSFANDELGVRGIVRLGVDFGVVPPVAARNADFAILGRLLRDPIGCSFHIRNSQS